LYWGEEKCILNFDREKLKRKKQLGRPRCRWENNIKMVCREVGLKGVDCIHLSQDTDKWWAFVNAVINLRVP
jgi:hypothetical protein